MPISLPLLDSLTNLANAYAESSPVHNQMASVRQEIGLIMNKYCQKSLDENNVSMIVASRTCSLPLFFLFLLYNSTFLWSNKIYLDMYYYYDAPATNKIVNWYGVILKIHQIILQSGLQPMLNDIATSIHSYYFPTDQLWHYETPRRRSTLIQRW